MCRTVEIRMQIGFHCYQFIYSLGVESNTPSTAASIGAMISLLSPLCHLFSFSIEHINQLILHITMTTHSFFNSDIFISLLKKISVLFTYYFLKKLKINLWSLNSGWILDLEKLILNQCKFNEVKRLRTIKI